MLAEVLRRLDSTDRAAVLAQVGRPWLAAVVPGRRAHSDKISSEIDMGDQYRDIHMGDRTSMRYRWGWHHLGYRYGIWADDIGNDSIVSVISHIDMGYLVTVATCAFHRPSTGCAGQGARVCCSERAPGGVLQCNANIDN